jgi:hypothetical protein
MHLEILNKEQHDLLPYIKKYTKNYYLVGGTAIALHLGHRASVDFDLFTEGKVNTITIKKQVLTSGFPSNVIVQKADQIHFTINSVKLTYFQFPFSIQATHYYQQFFRIPDLLTLAAIDLILLIYNGKLSCIIWGHKLDAFPFLISGSFFFSSWKEKKHN